MKQVIVDVDNTIANFAPIFQEELQRVCPKIPNCDKWTTWNFYNDYMPSNLFHDAAHAAQMRIMETQPLPGAREMLAAIPDNYRICIASHRKRESLDMLIDWLNVYDMTWTDIHVSNDKSVIFDNDTVMIIDDCPATMQAGMDFGFKAASLELPWNICMRGTGAFLGKTMGEVTDYVVVSLEEL
jgi:beta-phosphoglucomutase-like phosphatase (HAD superfamily)